MSANKTLNDVVKTCKVLLLDIEGTTSSISFVKNKLFPYAEENVKGFLKANWDKDVVKEAITGLRKLAIKDQENNVDGAVAILGEDAPKEEQIDSLVKSVKWQMSSDRKVGELKLLQGLIWKQGYENGDLKGHVFDDVATALEQWHSVEDQKVYIYSSGSVQAQKLLFGQSEAGDLLKSIDGHFDTAVGAKQDAASYKHITEKIGCKPESILFLTDIVKEAEAAREAGLQAALVSREGNAPLAADAAERFPVIHSLAELFATNKRKPEEQDEQPSKIPRTVVPEMLIRNEDSKETKETCEKTNSAEEVIVEETVEEIDDLNSNIPSIDVEPITIENVESDSTKDSGKLSSSNGKEDSSPLAKETMEVITEIQELTDEKQEIDDVTDIIDLEPVVEEPMATSEDIEELTKVGDVLEEECNEILSKVQDVTNLSTIQIKTFMDPIVEDAMETDSNDIAEKILDAELDLGVKECKNITLETVPELETSLNDNNTESDINVVECNTDVVKNVDLKSHTETVISEKNLDFSKPTEDISSDNVKNETKDTDKNLSLNGNKSDCPEKTINGCSDKNSETQNSPVEDSNAANSEAEVIEANGKMNLSDIKIKPVDSEITHSQVDQTT